MNRTANSAKPRWVQLTAAIIGNALEWYDFAVFAFLAVIISKVFFPAAGEYTGLLLTLATFGVGFLTRPLGGIAIGMYADRKGRKAALQLIIALMTASLLLMVLTPSYNTIGIAAPLLIVFARLLQGLATGGEFASATAYLVEAAPPGQKGIYGAWQMFGQGLANFFGALTGFLMTYLFSEQQLLDGMWRVPFLIGLLIAPVGWWMRRHLEEPEASVAQRATGEVTSLRTALSRHPKGIAATLALTTCATTSAYIFIIYMPTFVARQFHIPLNDAFMAQVIGLIAFIITVPITGALSDRYGRKVRIPAHLITQSGPMVAMSGAHEHRKDEFLYFSVIRKFLGQRMWITLPVKRGGTGVFTFAAQAPML